MPRRAEHHLCARGKANPAMAALVFLVPCGHSQAPATPEEMAVTGPIIDGLTEI